MRLRQGVTLDQADTTLRDAECAWENSRSAQHGYFNAYTEAVHKTYATLKQTFADPDLASLIRSPAYWNLLQIGRQNNGPKYTPDPDIARGWAQNGRADNLTLSIEIEDTIKALHAARAQLDRLKVVATRPGLPIIYDTNMFNHVKQPSDVDWKGLLNDLNEVDHIARLIVPLAVVDELDRQKNGIGKLADRAGKAVRYLEDKLRETAPGDVAQIREGATLEVWVETDYRNPDTDLSILMCATDLSNLHPATGARVLTNDFGMELRARQMNLGVIRLPEKYQKPSMNEGKTGANSAGIDRQRSD